MAVEVVASFRNYRRDMSRTRSNGNFLSRSNSNDKMEVSAPRASLEACRESTRERSSERESRADAELSCDPSDQGGG